MRAMRVQQPASLENIVVATATERAPGAGEIQVRVHASSLNFHDYAVVSGMLKCPDGVIPMSDGAGIVSAVGAGVTEFAVGDAVVSTFFPNWSSGRILPAKCAGVPGDHVDGFACETVTAATNSFTHAPVGYSHAEAATLTCAGLTAWRALVVEGQAKAGETVLVQGTGGVSVFALQFAKMLGCKVIATTSTAAKAEKLRQLGADHVINYRDNPEWGAEAYRIAGGGVDHVIEIGGAGTLGQSINACRMGGHIAMIGILAGVKGEVPTSVLMGKQIRLVGIMVGSREQQQDMIAAINANALKPVIDRVFPLESLADAFRYQLSGQHIGKICLEI